MDDAFQGRDGLVSARTVSSHQTLRFVVCLKAPKELKRINKLSIMLNTDAAKLIRRNHCSKSWLIAEHDAAQHGALTLYTEGSCRQSRGKTWAGGCGARLNKTQ